MNRDPATLGEALRACRGSFAYAAFFSLFVNLLMLVPTIYMLQIYDRVLGSGSTSTLLMLTLAVVFLFAVMGGLDWVRSQVLVATSVRFDALLADRVFDGMFAQGLASGGRAASAQPLADLLQLRQFLTGQGLFAFFDAPWLPIYLAVMFMFHPWLGVTGVAATLVLAAITWANELATRRDLADANRQAIDTSNETQRNLRNVEAIEAMGMLPRLRARWSARQQEMLARQARASRRGGLIGTASKTLRILLQSLVLGLGAYLAIQRDITGGAVIAGSILLGRALAPLDLMINSWRGFVAARGAWRRLDELLVARAAREPPMPLPAPRGELRLDGVVVKPPGSEAPVLRGVHLHVPAGSQLAVVGPSAAGKTTLARTVLGLCTPAAGTVRLDQADIGHWDRAALGPYIGYLPQDVELLDGSVADNIARFGPQDSAGVVAAATAAGVHEMILALPNGYDTPVAGHALSAGQRQRIGLARALYGEPRLIVLDEPDANLDSDGEAALSRTLDVLRSRGCTLVVVTHRRQLLAAVDAIVVLKDGQVALHGPRDKVLVEIGRATVGQAAVLRRAVAVPLRAATAGPGAGTAH